MSRAVFVASSGAGLGACDGDGDGVPGDCHGLGSGAVFLLVSSAAIARVVASIGAAFVIGAVAGIGTAAAMGPARTVCQSWEGGGARAAACRVGRERAVGQRVGPIRGEGA